MAIQTSFDGVDFKPRLDLERLSGQLLNIFEFMSDQKWHSLSSIEESTGYPQASISAQLRNLRKDRFGGHTIDRKRADNGSSGLFLYRLNDGGLE